MANCTVKASRRGPTLGTLRKLCKGRVHGPNETRMSAEGALCTRLCGGCRRRSATTSAFAHPAATVHVECTDFVLLVLACNLRYSLANGNLHLRHRGRFGKAALLRSLRQWKREKAAYLSLTREKSEVAMVVKEILDVRGRLNEMNEELERHSESMSQQDRRMERIEAILESMAVHLKVPLAPAKHLAPLQKAGATAAGQSEQKGPGSETRARVLAGGVGSQRGGIGWQWSESGSAPRNAESKLAPIGTTAVRASPSSGGDTNDADGDGDEDDLLVSSMGAGYSPTFGPLTGTMPLTLSQSGSRRNVNSNSVVPLGRIGALNADASDADATHE